MSGKFKGIVSLGQMMGEGEGYSLHRETAKTVSRRDRHLRKGAKLTKGSAKREFRAVKEIEDDVNGSNIVSW